MYFVQTIKGITYGKTLKRVNRKLDALLEENEFKQLGPDKVVILKDADLEFVQDKKRLSQVPIRNLYKKNSTVTLMLGIILLLQFIILVKK